jgi:hypothetical protein
MLSKQIRRNESVGISEEGSGTCKVRVFHSSGTCKVRVFHSSVRKIQNVANYLSIIRASCFTRLESAVVKYFIEVLLKT